MFFLSKHVHYYAHPQGPAITNSPLRSCYYGYSSPLPIYNSLESSDERLQAGFKWNRVSQLLTCSHGTCLTRDMLLFGSLCNLC